MGWAFHLRCSQKFAVMRAPSAYLGAVWVSHSSALFVLVLSGDSHPCLFLKARVDLRKKFLMMKVVG